MKRKLTLSSLAVLTFVASACGGGSSNSGSDGIASLDSVVPAAVEAEPASTDESTDGESIDGDQAEVETTTNDDVSNNVSDGEEVSDDDFDQAYLAYEQCLADIGLGGLVSGDSGGAVVEVDGDESIVVSDAGIEMTDEKFERMEDECDPILDGVAGSFEASPEQEAEMRDAELEFARCMRDQGFDMPDPSGSGGGFEIEIDGNGAIDQDAMDAAFETCDSVFDELFETEEG